MAEAATWIGGGLVLLVGVAGLLVVLSNANDRQDNDPYGMPYGALPTLTPRRQSTRRIPTGIGSWPRRAR
jgi:hypothetical protein